jgi:integrase/recombinase XerD
MYDWTAYPSSTVIAAVPKWWRRSWNLIRRSPARSRVRKASVARATPHMLRHTFATDLLRDEFNLREVQTALRHSDLRSTAIYTRVFDAELAAKLSRRR